MKKHAYNQRQAKPSVFLRIFCWLFRKEMIKLVDYADEICYTDLLKSCIGCGKDHCHVYWFTRVGDCILNVDGTIDSENSKSSYLRSWERV